MAKYRKKALIVTAHIADTHQYIATLEGITEAKVGDYIVTGVDNEQWAVRPKWFKDSYKHIADDKYQRIPQVLEAVQIHEEEYVKTPTGEIKGDKGDYKVTGTKGEQWFVKPDIFDKTYEKVRGNSQMKSTLQKAIEEIGLDAVQKSLGHSLALAYCDVHGHYAHTHAEQPNCPTCPPANGTTATEVEHYISVNPLQALGTNPQQKTNPMGV